MGVRIDVVLTSPLVRARQTAAILAEGLDVRPEVVTCAALAPGVTPRVSLEVVGRMTTPRRFALVGHEPGLGRLVASLIGGRRPIAFRKGGACRVDVSLWGERPAGTLVWFLPPRLLRTLGKT